MKHLDITVTGKVQGVFYRATTKTIAKQLGITGIVKNQPNGDVFIAAEAESPVLEQFLAWCHQGPEHARVATVTAQEGIIQGYSDFEVVR